jgi:hypothetical protein
MILFTLCPGITAVPAPVFPARYRPGSSPPAWSGSAAVVPLQLLYNSPFAVLHCCGRSFTLQVGSREEIVAVNRLNACTIADTAPGSLRHRSRPPGKRPGGSAAAKRVSFVHPLASTPSIVAPLRTGPRTVFLPSVEVFARPEPAALSTPPQQQNPPRQRTPPRYPHRQRTTSEDGPLSPVETRFACL